MATCIYAYTNMHTSNQHMSTTPVIMSACPHCQCISPRYSIHAITNVSHTQSVYTDFPSYVTCCIPLSVYSSLWSVKWHITWRSGNLLSLQHLCWVQPLGWLVDVVYRWAVIGCICAGEPTLAVSDHNNRIETCDKDISHFKTRGRPMDNSYWFFVVFLILPGTRK